MKGARPALRCGVALAAAMAATESAPGQQRPVFPSEIGVVVLQATVRNERGGLVAGLERSAFTVFENGRRQAVTMFDAEEVPVSIGLLLDHSRSVRRSRARAEAAALVLARVVRPGDEVFVLNFADKPAIDVPLTSDAQRLEAGIKGVSCIGATALRDAVFSARGYLAEHASRERRALVVVSDGGENASAVEEGDLRAILRRDAVAVYALGLLPADDAARADRGRRELETLVKDGGGAALFPRSDDEASRFALEIGREIRSRYTIGYTPEKQALDGSYRRIRVVARGAGKLTVHTRAGYRALAGQVTDNATTSGDQEAGARER